jgi:hypothetical protein
MSLLAQQELLESPPPRHVVVPNAIAAVPCWWGIDTSTAAYHVGFVYDRADGERVRGSHSVRLGPAGDNLGERLNRFESRLEELIVAMLAEGVPPPGVVFVEQPSGQNVIPVLSYAVGCATAITYRVVRVHGGYVPRVETVASAHWKKIAAGCGALNKTYRVKGERKSRKIELEDYGVLKWARVNGYDGPASWDHADCWGQAECARRDVAIRPQGRAD